MPEPAPGFHWISAPWGTVLRCAPLEEVAEHFFTARELRLRGDEADVAAEWGRVAEWAGVAPDRLRRMRQVHGCDVAIASSHEPASPGAATGPPQADALVTADPRIALAVQVADCVPLLIADPRTGTVAATHAGWRGAAADIAAATVRRLEDRFGARAHDLIAAVGPSIGPCCYQVGPEVEAAFLAQARTRGEAKEEARREDVRARKWFSPDVGDRLTLDMWQVVQDQLAAAGLEPWRVHVARLCTASHVDRFFSYRAEGPSTGRLLGVIRIKQERRR